MKMAFRQKHLRYLQRRLQQIWKLEVCSDREVIYKRRLVDLSCICLRNTSKKELYEKPSLFCVLFDTEKEQQQEMEDYLSEYTTQKNMDILYQSTEKLGANIDIYKNAFLLIGCLIGGIFALVGIINLMNLIMTSIWREDDMSLLLCRVLE